MKTLRLIKFNPLQNLATLYWEEDNFRRNTQLQTTDLPEQSQMIVAAALQWAVSQLPEGFERLESVEIKRIQDVVSEWSVPESEEEQAVPLSFSPAFVACIVGNGSKGQDSIEINSQPSVETNGLAMLWDELAK